MPPNIKPPSVVKPGNGGSTSKVVVPKLVPSEGLKKSGVKFKSYKPTERTYHKILVTGQPKMGKTYIIYKILEYNPNWKVFCINSDLGGSGSRTIVENLRRDNRLELMNNYEEIEVVEYNNTTELIYNLDQVELSNGKSLWEWGPDWLIWEGFTNWQERLQDYVLTFATTNDESKQVDQRRVEGFKAEIGDWDGIGRGSSRHFDNFLRLVNPITNKPIHKLITCYWKEKEEGVSVGKGPKKDPYEGPLLQGRFKSSFLGGFDLGIKTVKAIDLTTRKDKYIYKIIARRGFEELANTINADFNTVLDVIERDDYSKVRVEKEEEVEEIKEEGKKE